MKKNFTSVIRGLIKQEVNAIHTSLPAKVVRVDGMDVDVEPLVNLFQNGTHRKLPTIYSVPFMPPQTNKAGIQWNPEIGDKLILLVSEISIDNLMVSKGNDIVNSEDGRKFDLSDAIAISGFKNDNENKPLPKTDGLKIHYDDQTIIIKKNGDIEIGGGSVKKLINEEFVDVFNSHTHGVPVTTINTPVLSTPPSKIPTPLTPLDLITIGANELTSKTKAE